ncbi:exonuclease 1 [Lampris incognitus]|uniref:exonuclease 1 n=1 Tax=Lampris incognitus TaxID=2546036 RepID=UPI0024B5484F|nr:exonuclease 1 [Lampris incognitus]
MGISGLLQFIKDASEPANVKKYRGQTVAVDTYCWLHKGAFSCAEKLAKGEPTDRYVSYCMTFVDMLLSFDVNPILVFDGCNLPSKQDVEKSRRERRQANLQKGKQLLREGKVSEARDCFTRCINITPSMAHDVIKAARTRGVDCIVAPYEADAQLAFLSKSGIAQAVITEDSDLLAFGCKKVILKMDKQGNGVEVDQSHLGRCRSLGDVFTEEKFRYMCILSGCDYLASLYGIGVGKACKLIRMANNPDILKVIKNMGRYLKMNVVVPEEYIQGFVRANNTFLYQLVFDPVRRKVVPLNPYPEHIDPATLDYAGHNIGDEKGLQIALGNLDINTMAKLDDFSPDKPVTWPAKPLKSSRTPSIWRRGYTPLSVTTAQPAAGAPEKGSSNRGRERDVSLKGLQLPSRELQVKRPREDSGISDQEVLQLYCTPGKKRARSEELAAPTDTPTNSRPSGTGPPRPRNRFATLLQRRNQSTEEEDQGTCSRFFSSSCEVITSSIKESSEKENLSPVLAKEKSPPKQVLSDAIGVTTTAGDSTQVCESDLPEHPFLDIPSPPPSLSDPQPPSESPGAFHWSDVTPFTLQPLSGLSTLQRFKWEKGSIRQNAKSQEALGGLLNRTPANTDVESENADTLPDSPPSQDSAYFSQSQADLTSCSPSSPMSPAHLEDAESEMTADKDSDPDQGPTHPPEVEKKPSLVRSKVAGLPRLKPGDRAKVRKIQPVTPARASGLRRTQSGTGRKAVSRKENDPCPQTTISSLWKNFGYKKENPKLLSSQDSQCSE